MHTTNIMRKKQIDSFFDKERPTMMKFHNLLERDLSQTKLLNSMYKLVEEDKDFLDPYLLIAEILKDRKKTEESNAVLCKAYEGALNLIVDNKGRWPKEIMWGYLENRHIMRALEEYGNLCWQQGKLDDALHIFKNLLLCNPNDNQGVRYYILAIRLGLNADTYEEPFYVVTDGKLVGLDAIKISKWFEKHRTAFPEDFDAWYKIVQ